MIRDLITEETYLEDVKCNSWEELVDIGGGLLVKQGRVEPRFLQSIKDTIAEYGSYMVLVDDIAFFHGRPEAGVKDMAMSLVLLRDPVFLGEKRIKAAITFAAVDKNSQVLPAGMPRGGAAGELPGGQGDDLHADGLGF